MALSGLGRAVSVTCLFIHLISYFSHVSRGGDVVKTGMTEDVWDSIGTKSLENIYNVSHISLMEPRNVSPLLGPQYKK